MAWGRFWVCVIKKKAYTLFETILEIKHGNSDNKFERFVQRTIDRLSLNEIRLKINCSTTIRSSVFIRDQ